MSEDYIRLVGMLEGLKKAYTQINIMLHAEGKSLADFPQMEQIEEDNNEVNYLELAQAIEIGMSQYKQLNEKQKEIVDIILNKIDNNINCCYYIEMVLMDQVKHLYIQLFVI